MDSISALSSFEGSRKGLITEIIITNVASLLAISLRFWARAITVRKQGISSFWWDDWLALAALPFVIATSIPTWYLALYVSPEYKAQHYSEIPLLLYIAQIFYDTSITLPKLSVLCFYSRIFTHKRKDGNFRYAIWSVMGMVLAWWIAVTVLDIYSCTPIQVSWDLNVFKYAGRSKCIQMKTKWLSASATSAFLDLIILVLPLPKISRLQLSTLRKVLISGVFVCGYGVLAVSIGRLVYGIQYWNTGKLLNDSNWVSAIYLALASSSIMYWQILEAPVSIVSICLPSIFTLVRRLVNYGPSSLFSTRDYEISRAESAATHRSDTRLIGRTSATSAASNEETKETLEVREKNADAIRAWKETAGLERKKAWQESGNFV